MFVRLRIVFYFLLLPFTAYATDLVRPDPKLTPGEIASRDESKTCSTIWGKDARHVSEALKKKIAASYHIAWARHAQFEFDHLVPRELGGADAQGNIWPQPRAGRLNAHLKDVLENKLHRMVCARQISLAEAQAQIAKDWIAAYRRFFPAFSKSPA